MPVTSTPTAPVWQKPRAPAGIAGRWVASDGSWYRFDGEGPEYRVTSGGGPQGGGGASGTARLDGTTVEVVLQLPFVGDMRIAFEREGDHEIHGELELFGARIPMSFKRTSWPGRS